MSDEKVQAESDNPSNLIITAAVVVTVIGLVIMVAGVDQFFRFAIQDEVSAKQLTVPNAAKGKLRADEQKHLSSYQWVDKAGGVVRIPVERAQELAIRDWDKRAAAAPSVAPAPTEAAPAADAPKKADDDKGSKQTKKKGGK